MLNLIDNLLNRITMYRLVLYFLIILLAVAALFGYLGILPYSPLAIVFSSLLLVVTAWATNGAFAMAFETHANSESAYITALILALIITPANPGFSLGVGFLVWAAVLAMASKYIFALNKKHIFNPVAVAVVITSFAINQSASWWAGGNLPMMAFIVIGGLLITRKIQRFDLVVSYLITAGAMVAIIGLPFSPFDTIQKAILHTPAFFFAFIMLTEPLTTPPTRPLRILYGIFVGLLVAPAIHIGPIYSTPELALLVGNLFSYTMSPKKKYVLSLRERTEVGAGIYDFAFAGAAGMNFRPGQYMEWTLGYPHADSRGNRRYFTVASSPTEKVLRLGVRFYEKPSGFKKAMLGMVPGDTIVAGQLAGDFTLPKDAGKKLALIAGGIGVTPFRSMIKYLVDKDEPRDIVLLYSNRTERDIAYKDIFDEASLELGIKTVYAVTDRDGVMDAAFIRREIPDYHSRMFYLSGPRSMVTAFEKILQELGVPRTEIKTDFFPGFA